MDNDVNADNSNDDDFGDVGLLGVSGEKVK